MTRVVKLIASLTLLVLLCAAGLQAQAVSGNIIGTVTDPQGAAVPNAKVTVTSVGRGTSETYTTNESGNYTVTRLIPGRYNLKIEAPGFKSFDTKDLQVFADQSARVDASLQVGNATDSITVEAAAEQLKTDRADVSTTFTERQVTELPIFERNFTTFQLLTPGTQRLQWSHASSENPQGSAQIMVNGQHFSGTSFQLDGTDNRDPILGIIVINPTLESVTQAKITTQNYDAEFGQALAAVVTAQTKSGTNNVHGSTFWFRRSDPTQARNPFTQGTRNSLTGKFIPDTIWNQFGASIGGPIIKNRLFGFGDYQGTRSKQGNSLQTNIPAFPSDAARTTCLGGGPCDLSAYGTNIYDPLTGAQFPGNVIPANRVSPQAIALLKQLPAPNRPGNFNNFVGSGSGIFNNNQFNIRIDDQTTQRMHTFGRISRAQFTQSAVGLYGSLVGGPGLGIAGFGGLSASTNYSLAVGADYTFSPTFLTDFRYGWFRYHVNVSPNGVGTTPATAAGIPGLNTGNVFTSGMPAFFINGTGSFAFGYGLSDRLNRCNCPLEEKENQYQYVANFTKIAGNHQFKFGGDVRHANNLRVPSDAHRAGELSFEPQRTASAAGAGGLGLATFLIGDVTSFSRFVSPVTNAGESQNRDFWYGQDTWRVTPKLTFNYGLRWEWYFPQKVTCNGCGGFLSLSDAVVRVAGVGGVPRDMGVKMNWNNWAPRLGVAYQMTDSTVIRMGYGRSFDIGVFGSIFGHSVTQNLPVLTRQSINNGNNGVAFNLSAGPAAPTFPQPGSNGTIALGVGSPAATDKTYSILPERMRIPTVDAWNFTVQHEFTKTMTGEVAYVGNKGTHVFAGNGPDFNCNQARASFERGALGFNQSRPYFNSIGLNSDQRCLLNVSSNNYHSLQTRLEKRFTQGLSFLAHYTWGKGQNYDGNYFIYNPRLVYGPNDFDRTHVFVLTALYELPFGRGKMFDTGASRIVDAIIGGWQLNTVTTIQSGLPYNPGFFNNCPDSGPCRANKIGDPYAGVSQDRNHWFNPAAFSNPGGTTAFGNLPRNRLRGPGYWNSDLAFFKNFRFTEAVNAQFRAEGFNIFNHVNLDNPDSNLDPTNTNVGKITNLAPGATMRQWQFGLRIQF